TIAPTICEYLVCFAVIWGPFLQAFGVPVADFARCGPVIISQYPVAEAFLVIFMFKNYRRRFLRSLACIRYVPDMPPLNGM
ncbi:unnamed protein product, partial [Mesorhabditis belari]|uniref:Uncharacterized protein n=1 Tax=Mesorhabditis belari TaxID=2138241 RepID=A0AAF3EHT2_9BILA